MDQSPSHSLEDTRFNFSLRHGPRYSTSRLYVWKFALISTP